jgi:hypothetical protein
MQETRNTTPRRRTKKERKKKRERMDEMKEKCLARETYKYDSNTPYFNKSEMSYEIIEGASM